MPTAPTSPPTVSTLSSPPNRATDSATAYANKADTTMSEIPPMVTSQNSLATWQEDTAQEVYDNAVEANASASDAQASANAAGSLTNYAGQWSDLTGSLNADESVLHNNAFWLLLTNLADVTSSEPSSSNSDWQFVSGNTWLKATTSQSLVANSQLLVVSTTSNQEFTLPTVSTKEYFVVRNSKSSTENIKIINTSYAILGKALSLSSGDNIVLSPGSTVHLVPQTNTTLETV